MYAFVIGRCKCPAFRRLSAENSHRLTGRCIKIMCNTGATKLNRINLSRKVLTKAKTLKNANKTEVRKKWLTNFSRRKPVTVAAVR
jgi:hypothetical protein